MESAVKKTGKINYIEMPSLNLEATKAFFSMAFGWSFVEYGSEYIAIDDAGIDGGFYRSTQAATTANGSVLVVLYSNALQDTIEKVQASGGKIIKDIFSFPGGQRFHFTDPTGNEFAVWSDTET